MKKSLKLIALMLVLSLLLVACASTEDEEATVPDDTEQEKEQDQEQETEMVGDIELPYPTKIERDGETIGGTLSVALVSDTPFEGIFNTFLYSNNADARLMDPVLGSFMKSGPNREIVDGGYCNVEFDQENKTATYKIHPDLTWSDGVPVTSDDIIFVYESIAHADYPGVRFDSDYRNVVGIMDYHEGEADSISGLNRIDDKTLEVSFEEFYPGILWGAGLTYNAEPKHYLEDIPLEEMEAHENVRANPLSCGPFVVTNIVPGESVEYEPNPHWFGEEAKVDRIVMKRTSSDTIAEALKAGTFDVVDDLSVDSYEQYKDLSNISLMSNVAGVYGYVGFKHGAWDTEAKEVVADENMKMSDVNLRQAIAYAMNNEEVGEVFYNGLRIPANALITPSHTTFWHADQETYEYNPEKAMEILDEAGYVDVDDDGFREDPDGNKLQINFLSMSGGDIAEPLAQFYIQNWNDVGLDVVLQDGRLIEMNAFYDMVEEDNEDIDMYMGAWSTGSNPDPSGLYGRLALFNYPRYASERNDELLAAIASEDAFADDGSMDDDYLINAYHEWQEYIHEQVVVAPTHFRIELTAINNRVNYWDKNIVNDWGWEKIGVFEEEAELAQ